MRALGMLSKCAPRLARRHSMLVCASTVSPCFKQAAGAKARITMLGLFINPKGQRPFRQDNNRYFWNPLGGRFQRKWCRMPTHLNAEQDMREVTAVLPFGQHLIMPAARFPEDMLKVTQGRNRVYPRVMHFAAHGFQGGLLVETAATGVRLPLDWKEATPTITSIYTTAEIVEQMGGVVANCPELECVLLMCCNSEEIALALHAEYSHLRIIYWEYLLHDDAAIGFGLGFYTCLARSFSQSAHDSPSIDDAFCEAEWKFLERNFTFDNPTPHSRVPGSPNRRYGGKVHMLPEPLGLRWRSVGEAPPNGNELTPEAYPQFWQRMKELALSDADQHPKPVRYHHACAPTTQELFAAMVELTRFEHRRFCPYDLEADAFVRIHNGAHVTFFVPHAYAAGATV